MVELIPPPDPRTLLPPLLACLPAAFVSTRPPPALLPLLSPILRQRVQILSSVATSPSDCWIRLLCWGDEKADRVQSLLDGADFEPHAASGKIEVPDDLPVTYKRLDEETLHSQIVLPQYNLSVLYLWCPNDQQGPGWRVAELLPREGPSDDDATWSTSIGEANERARERLIEEALKNAEQQESRAPPPQAANINDDDDDDDDDAYWAQYDNTPGRTPAIKTPAPRTFASVPAVSEDSYFARYADVQPAMDHDDPSQDPAEVGVSSLNGNILANLLQQHAQSREAKDGQPAGQAPHDAVATMLSHPRPASTSSSGSDAVAKLEQEAESQSASEMAVKQHIGSSIKSLFRLARSTGMAREEFQSLVRTELELLNLADDE
ncbi:hypothetical protein T310_5259 [Rasamsonia emersonii CBS 393.64]|uniref:Uncharacterized protein n=1 Tax=Rasamsonia emersonii (strain ATCC 16479 / CBS 393.64 / IMI 116815) TaxID=1408163 RepID=A0A0F4YSA7_RASE3|nr:hypothetical protein T310_5259 [Rasamsonia emersonii CBS 393.64]KKA20721.1 hypothetical protein T310_5259 [Rasamsonia emersonii CBS 393.64]